MKEKLLLWLKNQQNTIDKIIKLAAEDFYVTNSTRLNFAFDLKECQEESYNLVGKKDLCYDRPNTAFVYSMWYHARRVNTFLTFFTDAFFKNNTNEKIEIFDLGAGTGAIQWSIALILCGMKSLGASVPKVTVINVDSSPFMLEYNEKYLWKHFIVLYPEICNLDFQAKYSVNSWQNPDNLTLSNPWIASSYLFDISDNEEEITKSFLELIDSFKPITLLLITSDQEKKRQILSRISSSLIAKQFVSLNIYETNQNLLFSGKLLQLSNFREKLGTSHVARGLNNNVTWNDKSFVGVGFTKAQTSLALNVPLKLYTISEKNRAKIKLSSDQIEASKHSDRPTIITGPAGCGKSVVLTERIKNLIEMRDYNPNLKILVTTFNKDLINYLGDWLQQLLNEDVRRTGLPNEKISYFFFKGSSKPNISVLHFDVLPTRLPLEKKLKISYTLKSGDFSGDIEEYHIYILQKIAIEKIKREKLNEREYKQISNGNFLFEEYHRVIYGYQCITYKKYFDVERKGRGRPVLKKNHKRKFVWDVVNEYIQFLKKENIDSFTLRRFRLLQNILENGFPNKFDYVYVDELQDCTDADFAIFYNILKDSNNIVLTGDLAQSIHLGTSSQIPKNTGMGNFDRRNKLQGSFRLPYRISEAIKKISEEINDRRKGLDEGDIINPFKGSPPGARPIIFYARTQLEVKTKIKDIYETYKIYNFDAITIFEKDERLKNIILETGIEVNTETILRAKGMEKPCVLWSTREKVISDNEIWEYVYTILTRASALLIIVISESTIPEYRNILSKLDLERIIFYDEHSKNKFLDLISINLLTEHQDEEDENDIYEEIIDDIESLMVNEDIAPY